VGRLSALAERPARSRRVLFEGIALGALLVFLTVLSPCYGTGEPYSLSTSLRGLGALFGLADPLEGTEQTVYRWRLWRALTASGAGACLALAGAYLQGLFRNGLASPAVIGVTAGSVFGASLAIASIGGFGPGVLLAKAGALSPFLVTVSAFAGALGVSVLVLWIATRSGRLSVTTLLLAGIAINTLIAGFLAALQSLTLRDLEVSRAILSWTFGTLEDRSDWQVVMVWAGFAVAALWIPFVSSELDLFGGGEEDAQALGVEVQRVKLGVLVAAALATSAAVSVAGQIAFVGLVIPHLVRMLFGTTHRRVLPLSALAGALLLLGCDVMQRVWLSEVEIRPGVLMSLIGGPFFLYLLMRERHALRMW